MTARCALPVAIRERAWWALWERLLSDPSGTPVVEPVTPDPEPAPEADEAPTDTAAPAQQPPGPPPERCKVKIAFADA